MEYINVVCKTKTFKIKRKTIIFILNRLSEKDWSKADDKTILKLMKKYCLIDKDAAKM